MIDQIRVAVRGIALFAIGRLVAVLNLRSRTLGQVPLTSGPPETCLAAASKAA